MRHDMFQKVFTFRRKSSDQGRLSRYFRTPSESGSPNPSPSSGPQPTQGDRDESTPSLPRISSLLDSGPPNDRPRKNSESDPGQLGLNVVYSPPNGHKADIIFIHGLGGASRRTWSQNEDPDLFWPLTFLPLEPDVCLARIMTFGYNANFRAAGKVSVSVLDFAKDLLFDLKYAKDNQRNDLNIGDVPLVFVTHSMGGLVIKEAYMQGQNDPEYESIIKAISAIIFLATPHRGTNLAELLDRILRSTILGGSKQYVTELSKNSYTLQRLNEQFRHIAPRLDIVSFYESQPTAIGLKNSRVMILEKDSSVLGYPGETSKKLDADHHNICKYHSPSDPNYVNVRNALKSLVSKMVSSSKGNRDIVVSRSASLDLRSLLAVTELPDIDYIYFRDQWVPGTSEWVLEDDDYLKWLDDSASAPSLLWIHGGAATGKSVLSSFIINSLVEQGLLCQYFFVRFGDQTKRTLSLLLRSLAYQIARCMPDFLQRALQLIDEAIDFETADPRTIWERVFKHLLFNMEETRTLYWVIDGLDEADDPKAFIKLLSDIPSSSAQIKILLVGRKTPEIDASLHRIRKTLNRTYLGIEGHLQDFRSYVQQELNMSGTPEYRETIAQRLVVEAQNNFLWVRLAVDELNLCHTQADVDAAFRQLAVGMEALYDRMALSITQKPAPKDRALASIVLQCVTCSLRVLAVAELSEALHDDTDNMLDFQRSIVDLCGGFITIDNGGHVALIHQTAREYLLGSTNCPLRFDRVEAHKEMFMRCMRCLIAPGLRAKVNKGPKPEFLAYASQTWFSHLGAMSTVDEQVVDILRTFLTGNWVLLWIHILAATGHLRVLIQASRYLSKSSTRQSIQDAAEEGASKDIILPELFRSWAEDFVKIVGKFGAILRQNPESVYKFIPPFCPSNSAIYQQFGKLKDRSLAISGLSTGNWDDSVARISLGSGGYASSISAAGGRLAVLVSSGSVVLYDSSTFEELAYSPLSHGERLYRMEMDSSGAFLVSYGYLTTKVWELATGECTISIKNLATRPRPLTMLLRDSDQTLLVGSDDRRLRSLDLRHESPTWQLVAEFEEPEIEGHFLNASNCMALSKDGSLIVVAYRGHPLSAWETHGPTHIGHCWRKRDELARGEVIEAVWHPHKLEVLGLYLEGVVFKWRPYSDETEELSVGASRLAISKDGHLFATGDVRGTVKVYTVSEFRPLFHLVSEDVVLGLAFSPNLRRFYDIRGQYGNAWEPNALAKYAEQRGQDVDDRSEMDSLAQSSIALQRRCARIDSITAIAESPLGQLYCCGTMTGKLHLHNTQRGRIQQLHAMKGFLSIEQMSWSSDGSLLGYSDANKRVFIASITRSPDSQDHVIEKKAEIPMKDSASGPILQLLFHPNSSQLLVRSSSTVLIVSLTSFSITDSMAIRTTECTWVAHPQDVSVIIAISPSSLQVLDWSLAKQQAFVFRFSNAEDKSTTDSESLQHQQKLGRVLVSRDKNHILVAKSASNHHAKVKTFFYFATRSCFPTESAAQSINQSHTSVIDASIISSELSSHIAIPLALLAHNELIFLSKRFAVRSVRLMFDAVIPSVIPQSNLQPNNALKSFSSPAIRPTQGRWNDLSRKDEDHLKALFYLPGDWISRDSLALCRIWGPEKSFLCPRNGEIGVVRCSGLT